VCCATVVPGLRHGVHCIELAIKRAPPALRGVAQLDVWLVRRRVQPSPGASRAWAREEGGVGASMLGVEA